MIRAISGHCPRQPRHGRLSMVLDLWRHGGVAHSLLPCLGSSGSTRLRMVVLVQREEERTRTPARRRRLTHMGV
jgi:hypothetical protein